MALPSAAFAQSESRPRIGRAAAGSAAPAAGSVKVGFISPTTGFVAALGTDMKRGWELYWEQNGNTAGGVTVETVFEDDTGDPGVALTKAQRLVEEEGVQFVAGPILANTAYAVADYVAEAGIPTFQITGADDLTQRQFDPLVLRAGYTSSQSNFPAGQWAYDEGHRNAVTICPDYPFGWESCGGFVKAFTDAGGTVTQIWHPLGTQDFSSYVTEIQAANPDVVFIGSAGGPDAILFWQAWTGFGLQERPAHRELLLRRPGPPARSGRCRERHHELQLLDRGPRFGSRAGVRRGVRGQARRGPVAVRGRLVPDGAALRDDARADRRGHRRSRVHRRRPGASSSTTACTDRSRSTSTTTSSGA